MRYACQVESFPEARRHNDWIALVHQFSHGDKFLFRSYDIHMNLVTDEKYIIAKKDILHLLQIFSRPSLSCRVMRFAMDEHVIFRCLAQFFKVLKVEGVLIILFEQRAWHHFAAIAL